MGVIGLAYREFVRRHVMRIPAQSTAVDHERVSANDTDDERWRKELAVVLAQRQKIMIGHDIVELGFILDQLFRATLGAARPCHLTGRAYGCIARLLLASGFVHQELDHALRVEKSPSEVSLTLSRNIQRS